MALPLVSVAFGALACRGRGGERASRPVVAAIGEAQAAVAGGARPALATFPAERCSECHSAMYDEWRGSAHARSAHGPTFAAFARAARAETDPRAGCDRCHAPLRALAPAGDPIAEEGVTCDVCHTLKSVETRPGSAAFTLAALDNVRFGPRCDAKDHYFHRMGCSPIHEEAKFCAGCHLYYRTGEGGQPLPVYTEYEEWLESPYAEIGRSCQSCHMPGARGEIARGSPPRDGVPHHGFLGKGGNLRQRALTMQLEVAERDGRLHVTANVVNRRAGHQVPTGQPERRVVLRVRTISVEGVEVDYDERVYGRLLGDAAGKEVPFHAATRVLLDNRLKPKEPRTESFSLAGPPAGEVRAEVVYQPIAPVIARQLGLAPPVEQVLLEAHIRFDAPGTRGARGRLPATLLVKGDSP